MPFAFTCPTCRHTSQVLEQLAGTQAKCPSCGVVVRIPQIGVPQTPVAAVPVVAAAPVAAAEHSPQPSKPVISRPARPSKSGAGVGLLLVLLLGGVLGLTCFGASGFGVYWVYFRNVQSEVNSAVASGPVAMTLARAGPGRAAATQPGGPAQIHGMLLKSTAWMITSDGRKAAIGTAAVVHRELRLLLTNYHVIHKFPQVVVMFPQYGSGGAPITLPNAYIESAAEKGFKARVVASDPSRDLALLQVDHLPADVQEIKLAVTGPAAGQTFHTLGAAEKITGFGMQEGVLWRYSKGQVKQVRQHEFRYADGQRVQARVLELPSVNDPNDYGDPVVDDAGRLLGVTCDLGTARAKTCCAIDVRDVRTLLENYFSGIGRRWADDSSGGSTPPGPATAVDDENTQPSYWIQVLKQPEDASAEKARTRLIQMGRGAVLELRKALRDDSPRLRLAVASILGEMGENAAGAAEDLAKLLADPEATVRATAAESLGKMGPAARPALRELIQANGDANAAVRTASVEALRRVGPPAKGDVARLLPLWQDPSRQRRDAYVAAVRRLKPSPEAAVELFVPLLKDDDANVRAHAADALGDAGTAVHIPAFAALLSLIGDSSGEVRRAAVAALGKVGPATAGDRNALETGLHGKFPEGRLFCVSQLANLGADAKGSVPDIARLLRDPDAKTRTAAARALGCIGKPAVGVLDDLIGARRDAEPGVRAAAVEALGGLGREMGVAAALFESLQDKDKDVRAAAVKSLRGLQPPLGADDMVPLRVAFKSQQLESRRFAAAEFARMGKEVDTLRDATEGLTDADPEVRRHLFAVLAIYGTEAKDSAPAVLEAMSMILQSGAKAEGSLELFRQASITLGKIGDPAAAVPVWGKALKSSNKAFRKEVLNSLAQVGPPARKAAKEMAALLEDAELAGPAGETLLKLGGDDVVKALRDVADESPSVPAKLAAVRLLGKMGPAAKDAFQVLYRTSIRYRGKELGDAAAESLKLVQAK